MVKDLNSKMLIESEWRDWSEVELEVFLSVKTWSKKQSEERRIDRIENWEFLIAKLIEVEGDYELKYSDREFAENRKRILSDFGNNLN